MTYDDAFMDGYYSAMEEFDSIDDDGLYDLDYFMPLDDDYSYEGYYDEYDPYTEGYYDAMEAFGKKKQKGGVFEKIKNAAIRIIEAIKKFLTETLPNFFKNLFGGNKPKGFLDKLKKGKETKKLNSDSNKLANATKILAGMVGVGFAVGGGVWSYKQYTRANKAEADAADWKHHYSSTMAQGRQAAKERDYYKGEAERFHNKATEFGKENSSLRRSNSRLEGENARLSDALTDTAYQASSAERRADSAERRANSEAARADHTARERDYYKGEADRYRGAATSMGADANALADQFRIVSDQYNETKQDLEDVRQAADFYYNKYVDEMDNRKVLERTVDSQADQLMQHRAGQSQLHGRSRRNYQHGMYEEGRRQSGINYQ